MKLNQLVWYLASVFAQTTSLKAAITLPDMIVASTPKQLEQQINPIETFDNQDISAAHYRSISDVLRGANGLNIAKPGGYGQTADMSMRGAGGLGLLSLDDIPLILAFPGSMNLDTLPTEALQNAEIERGPGQAHHSFQALGGAIRLYTLDKASTGTGLSVEGGTFGLLRETLHGNLSGKAGRLTLSASRGDTFNGGYFADSIHNPERDPYHFTQTLLRFNTDLTHQLNWQGSFLYLHSWTGADQLGMDTTGRTTFIDDFHGYNKFNTWLAQNKLTLEISPSWKSSLQVGFTQQSTAAFESEYLNLVSSQLFLVNWRNQHPLINNSSKALQWHLEWGGQGRYEKGASPTGSFFQDRLMASGFIESSAQYGRLSSNLGFRLEHFDRFGDHPLFSSSTAWKFNQNLTLRASGGTGYRIPSYTEMLFLYFGNPNLKPERSASGSLAVEWYLLKSLKLDLKGFYQNYTNLISIAVDPITASSTQNISHAESKGVEFSTNYIWNANFEQGFNYTYTDTRNLDTHKDIPFRSKHNAKLWCEWKPLKQPLTLRAETFYQGNAWNDFGNTSRYHEAFLVNLIARYNVTSKLEFYIRGENLTDNRRAQHYNLDKPGATVYGGFQLNL